MRVFRNRAEAEAAGVRWEIVVGDGGRQVVADYMLDGASVIIRTDLETQLAEALEVIETDLMRRADAAYEAGETDRGEWMARLAERATEALKAFRGDPPA